MYIERDIYTEAGRERRFVMVRTANYCFTYLVLFCFFVVDDAEAQHSRRS